MILFGAVAAAEKIEWQPVTRTQEFILYASTDSKIRGAARVLIWEMKNYYAPQTASTGKQYLSVKIQSEYDCEAKKTRFLSLIFYSGHLGNGKVVSVFDNPLQWSSIAPGTVSDQLRSYACTSSN